MWAALKRRFHRKYFLNHPGALKKTPAGNNRDEVKARLISGSKSCEQDLFAQYNPAGKKGLSAEAIESSRKTYGDNVIAHKRRLSVLGQLADAFVSPFAAVLLVLAVISFFTDYLYASGGSRTLSSVIIILSIVTISGVLKFIQESRGAKSADALAQMVKTNVDGTRDGQEIEIPLDEIVVGDIVELAAGDIIPGDLRILEAKDLFVSESSLTGESEPVEKLGDPYAGDSTNPIDCSNLAFMGSSVVSGSATGMVLTVGKDTYFGQIAETVTGKDVQTSFDKGVNAVSWVLIRFMLVMVPVVLVLTGLSQGNWLNAFLFALAIAVGLTPEMLPMIVSANLAKGAVAMSKKRVIVKNLNSIQNFGSMNILCTDKTGTLTEDRIVLEHYLNVNGKEDDRVLRHGFLNSYFQTGFRNTMDHAIIDRGDSELSGLSSRYHKIDEIPFDFTRRRMSVVVEDQTGKRQMITKGAIEEMLLVSKYVEMDGKVEALTDELAEKILASVNGYNADGLRVLGISQRSIDLPDVGAFDVATENDLVLMGYLAFLDPPKESATIAIKSLHDYGVAVKVLTGDNDAVARKVCREVGVIADSHADVATDVLTGTLIEDMSDDQLDAAVTQYDVFAKLSPQQKVRIIQSLRRIGNTVGFMGDGINDAAAMKEADVGISVDTAVDIAKESANIILLEKDLTVLQRGVIEGRKVYGNTIKYIKMTVSSNFGNMLSVLTAAAFLPFLPMLPLQILLLNLIYDISCITMPWDNVDEEFIKEPRGWDASSVQRFMFWFGPTSSIFDIATFIVMFFWIGPAVMGGSFGSLSTAHQAAFIALFHAAWFVASLWTQTIVIHGLRTPKVPFLQSRAARPVVLMTTLGLIVGTVLPFTTIGKDLGLHTLPWSFFVFLAATCIAYFLLVALVKKVYIHKYSELL